LIRLPFDCNSTTYVTTGLLHCSLDKQAVRVATR